MCLHHTEVKSAINKNIVLYSFKVGEVYDGEIFSYSGMFSWRIYIDGDNYVYSRANAGHFVEINEWRNSQLEKIGI
jgi:hypothetical protein